MSMAEDQTAPRVGVIGHAVIGAAYERLDECSFDVMAVVPGMEHVNPTFLREYDVMLTTVLPPALGSVLLSRSRKLHTLAALSAIPNSAS